jgi:hypothetical protein
MAVEEIQQQTPYPTPAKFQGGVVEIDAHGNIRRIVVSGPVTERFDMTFVWDVVIAIVLFVAAVICLVNRVPIAGHPSALLLGPLVGLILTLKHRPPR